MTFLKLATRGSDLARHQAEQVATLLREATGAATELVIVSTHGDRVQDVVLGDAGAIGLFTSEVQQAVLDGRADYAVHSLKDLPAEQVQGLRRAAVPGREDPRDLLLARPEAWRPERSPIPLPDSCRVGTAAARRSAFLRAMVPGCSVELLRGNVPTRLAKLRNGEHDAILLAAAGVRRLGLDLSGLAWQALDLDLWPCAPGQGALAVECREDDEEVASLLAKLDEPETAELIDAERGVLRALGGGCGLPLGAHATREEGAWRLCAALGPTDDRPGAAPLVRADVTASGAAELVEAARAELLEEEVSC